MNRSPLLPGNTDLSFYKKSDTNLTSLSSSITRPVIILATNEVNDDTLFRNGLTQNIVVLYDLFESLGYTSYLFQHTSSHTDKKPFINNYKIINVNDILRGLINIKIFIEIGMSIDATTRAYLRSSGTKIIKLYLGNILNIDIETIQNFNSMFFSHHIVGEIDEIWTSPHYKQHIDYAAVINRTEIKNSRIVPYVWDSCFVTQYGTKDIIEWTSPSSWQTQDIVIMDPNISFQKCYFYSLLLCEAFSKKYTEWQGKVHIINGDRLKIEMNSNNLVLPSLTLYTKNRIVLHGRKNIHTILKEHKSSCFITHQWNNDFNYMTLELLYCNYPILHNSEGWDDFGYHYSINKWDEAIKTMYNALVNHKVNLNIYKTHAANLIWKHSIHNPDIQSEWKTILQ
jgi:hypothetical protein